MNVKKIVSLILLMLFAHASFAANVSSSDYEWLKRVCRDNRNDWWYGNYWYWQCEWLKDNDKEDEDKDRYQDMKNFLALSQLKQAKAQAEMMFLKPPALTQSMQAGFKDEQARRMADPVKKIYQNYFSDWNILLRPGVADQDYFINNHIDNYCSQNEAKAGVCIVRSSSKEPVDLSASSLLSQNVLPNKSAQDAASLYIRNLTNPIPVPLLPPKEMFKNVDKKILSDEGKKNLSAKFRQQTMTSLAQESLLNMLAERMPFENLDGKSPDSAQQNLSRLNLLEQEANRRFNNPSWYNDMNTMSTEALLREIANMMALQLTMEYRDSKRLERIEALMSAQVAYVAQLIGAGEQSRQASHAMEKEGEAN